LGEFGAPPRSPSDSSNAGSFGYREAEIPMPLSEVADCSRRARRSQEVFRFAPYPNIFRLASLQKLTIKTRWGLVAGRNPLFRYRCHRLVAEPSVGILWDLATFWNFLPYFVATTFRTAIFPCPTRP